jgi:phosphoribosylanthranilate isomerase
VAVHFKVCGITNIDDAKWAIEVGASAIGLNLVPGTPRAIDVDAAREIATSIGERALAVLVVADRGVSEMKDLLRATRARCLQLHGDEPIDVVRAVLPHAYKAVRVGSREDAERATEFPGEHLLVDAKVEGKLGGTGKTVDWSLVAPLARVRKLTLAGGLNEKNVAQAIAIVRPYCVDVASGVETDGDPRRKDREKLRAFSRAIRESG